jgi:serine-type D-Ala-D-Ala carboxypeptidase/endopeptidase
VPRFELPALAGAGAPRSTASDMLRFLETNLDPAGPRSRPRWNASSSHDTGWPGMGLGWLLVPSPEPPGPLLWHYGGTNGFRSFVGVLRDRSIAVVVLSNSARSVDRLGFQLLRVLSTGVA